MKLTARDRALIKRGSSDKSSADKAARRARWESMHRATEEVAQEEVAPTSKDDFSAKIQEFNSTLDPYDAQVVVDPSAKDGARYETPKERFARLDVDYKALGTKKSLGVLGAAAGEGLIRPVAPLAGVVNTPIARDRNYWERTNDATQEMSGWADAASPDRKLIRARKSAWEDAYGVDLARAKQLHDLKIKAAQKEVGKNAYVPESLTKQIKALEDAGVKEESWLSYAAASPLDVASELTGEVTEEVGSFGMLKGLKAIPVLSKAGGAVTKVGPKVASISKNLAQTLPESIQGGASSYVAAQEASYKKYIADGIDPVTAESMSRKDGNFKAMTNMLSEIAGENALRIGLRGWSVEDLLFKSGGGVNIAKNTAGEATGEAISAVTETLANNAYDDTALTAGLSDSVAQGVALGAGTGAAISTAYKGVEIKSNIDLGNDLLKNNKPSVDTTSTTTTAPPSATKPDNIPITDKFKKQAILSTDKAELDKTLTTITAAKQAELRGNGPVDPVADAAVAKVYDDIKQKIANGEDLTSDDMNELSAGLAVEGAQTSKLAIDLQDAEKAATDRFSGGTIFANKTDNVTKINAALAEGSTATPAQKAGLAIRLQQIEKTEDAFNTAVEEAKATRDSGDYKGFLAQRAAIYKKFGQATLDKQLEAAGNVMDVKAPNVPKAEPAATNRDIEAKSSDAVEGDSLSIKGKQLNAKNASLAQKYALGKLIRNMNKKDSAIVAGALKSGNVILVTGGTEGKRGLNANTEGKVYINLDNLASTGALSVASELTGIGSGVAKTSKGKKLRKADKASSTDITQSLKEDLDNAKDLAAVLRHEARHTRLGKQSFDETRTTETKNTKLLTDLAAKGPIGKFMGALDGELAREQVDENGNQLLSNAEISDIERHEASAYNEEVMSLAANDPAIKEKVVELLARSIAFRENKNANLDNGEDVTSEHRYKAEQLIRIYSKARGTRHDVLHALAGDARFMVLGGKKIEFNARVMTPSARAVADSEAARLMRSDTIASTIARATALANEQTRITGDVVSGILGFSSTNNASREGAILITRLLLNNLASDPTIKDGKVVIDANMLGVFESISDSKLSAEALKEQLADLVQAKMIFQHAIHTEDALEAVDALQEVPGYEKAISIARSLVGIKVLYDTDTSKDKDTNPAYRSLRVFRDAASSPISSKQALAGFFKDVLVRKAGSITESAIGDVKTIEGKSGFAAVTKAADTINKLANLAIQEEQYRKALANNVLSPKATAAANAFLDSYPETVNTLRKTISAKLAFAKGGLDLQPVAEFLIASMIDSKSTALARAARSIVSPVAEGKEINPAVDTDGDINGEELSPVLETAVVEPVVKSASENADLFEDDEIVSVPRAEEESVSEEVSYAEESQPLADQEDTDAYAKVAELLSAQYDTYGDPITGLPIPDSRVKRGLLYGLRSSKMATARIEGIIPHSPKNMSALELAQANGVPLEMVYTAIKEKANSILRTSSNLTPDGKGLLTMYTTAINEWTKEYPQSPMSIELRKLGTLVREAAATYGKDSYNYYRALIELVAAGKNTISNQDQYSARDIANRYYPTLQALNILRDAAAVTDDTKIEGFLNSLSYVSIVPKDEAGFTETFPPLPEDSAAISAVTEAMQTAATELHTKFISEVKALIKASNDKLLANNKDINEEMRVLKAAVSVLADSLGLRGMVLPLITRGNKVNFTAKVGSGSIKAKGNSASDLVYLQIKEALVKGTDVADRAGTNLAVPLDTLLGLLPQNVQDYITKHPTSNHIAEALAVWSGGAVTTDNKKLFSKELGVLVNGRLLQGSLKNRGTIATLEETNKPQAVEGTSAERLRLAPDAVTQALAGVTTIKNYVDVLTVRLAEHVRVGNFSSYKALDAVGKDLAAKLNQAKTTLAQKEMLLELAKLAVTPVSSRELTKLDRGYEYAYSKLLEDSHSRAEPIEDVDSLNKRLVTMLGRGSYSDGLDIIERYNNSVKTFGQVMPVEDLRADLVEHGKYLASIGTTAAPRSTRKSFNYKSTNPLHDFFGVDEDTGRKIGKIIRGEFADSAKLDAVAQAYKTRKEASDALSDAFDRAKETGDYPKSLIAGLQTIIREQEAIIDSLNALAKFELLATAYAMSDYTLDNIDNIIANVAATGTYPDLQNAFNVMKDRIGYKEEFTTAATKEAKNNIPLVSVIVSPVLGIDDEYRKELKRKVREVLNSGAVIIVSRFDKASIKSGQDFMDITGLNMDEVEIVRNSSIAAIRKKARNETFPSAPLQTIISEKAKRGAINLLLDPAFQAATPDGKRRMGLASLNFRFVPPVFVDSLSPLMLQAFTYAHIYTPYASKEVKKAGLTFFAETFRKNFVLNDNTLRGLSPTGEVLSLIPFSNVVINGKSVSMKDLVAGKANAHHYHALNAILDATIADARTAVSAADSVNAARLADIVNNNAEAAKETQDIKKLGYAEANKAIEAEMKASESLYANMRTSIATLEKAKTRLNVSAYSALGDLLMAYATGAATPRPGDRSLELGLVPETLSSAPVRRDNISTSFDATPDPVSDFEVQKTKELGVEKRNREIASVGKTMPLFDIKATSTERSAAAARLLDSAIKADDFTWAAGPKDDIYIMAYERQVRAEALAKAKSEILAAAGGSTDVSADKFAELLLDTIAEEKQKGEVALEQEQSPEQGDVFGGDLGSFPTRTYSRDNSLEAKRFALQPKTLLARMSDWFNSIYVNKARTNRAIREASFSRLSYIAEANEASRRVTALLEDPSLAGKTGRLMEDIVSAISIRAGRSLHGVVMATLATNVQAKYGNAGSAVLSQIMSMRAQHHANIERAVTSNVFQYGRATPGLINLLDTTFSSYLRTMYASHGLSEGARFKRIMQDSINEVSGLTGSTAFSNPEAVSTVNTAINTLMDNPELFPQFAREVDNIKDPELLKQRAANWLRGLLNGDYTFATNVAGGEFSTLGIDGRGSLKERVLVGPDYAPFRAVLGEVKSLQARIVGSMEAVSSLTSVIEVLEVLNERGLLVRTDSPKIKQSEYVLVSSLFPNSPDMARSFMDLAIPANLSKVFKAGFADDGLALTSVRKAFGYEKMISTLLNGAVWSSSAIANIAVGARYAAMNTPTEALDMHLRTDKLWWHMLRNKKAVPTDPQTREDYYKMLAGGYFDSWSDLASLSDTFDSIAESDPAIKAILKAGPNDTGGRAKLLRALFAAKQNKSAFLSNFNHYFSLMELPAKIYGQMTYIKTLEGSSLGLSGRQLYARAGDMAMNDSPSAAKIVASIRNLEKYSLTRFAGFFTELLRTITIGPIDNLITLHEAGKPGAVAAYSAGLTLSAYAGTAGIMHALAWLLRGLFPPPPEKEEQYAVDVANQIAMLSASKPNGFFVPLGYTDEASGTIRMIDLSFIAAPYAQFTNLTADLVRFAGGDERQSFVDIINKNLMVGFLGKVFTKSIFGWDQANSNLDTESMAAKIQNAGLFGAIRRGSKDGHMLANLLGVSTTEINPAQFIHARAGAAFANSKEAADILKKAYAENPYKYWTSDEVHAKIAKQLFVINDAPKQALSAIDMWAAARGLKPTDPKVVSFLVRGDKDETVLGVLEDGPEKTSATAIKKIFAEGDVDSNSWKSIYGKLPAFQKSNSNSFAALRNLQAVVEGFVPMELEKPVAISNITVKDGDTFYAVVNGNREEIRGFNWDVADTGTLAKDGASAVNWHDKATADLAAIFKQAKGKATIQYAKDPKARKDENNRMLAYVFINGEDLGGIIAAKNIGYATGYDGSNVPYQHPGIAKDDFETYVPPKNVSDFRIKEK